MSPHPVSFQSCIGMAGPLVSDRLGAVLPSRIKIQKGVLDARRRGGKIVEKVVRRKSREGKMTEMLNEVPVDLILIYIRRSLCTCAIRESASHSAKGQEPAIQPQEVRHPHSITYSWGEY